MFARALPFIWKYLNDTEASINIINMHQPAIVSAVGAVQLNKKIISFEFKLKFQRFLWDPISKMCEVDQNYWINTIYGSIRTSKR